MMYQTTRLAIVPQVRRVKVNHRQNPQASNRLNQIQCQKQNPLSLKSSRKLKCKQCQINMFKRVFLQTLPTKIPP